MRQKTSYQDGPPFHSSMFVLCAQHCHRIVTLRHDKDLIRQNTTGAGLAHY